MSSAGLERGRGAASGGVANALAAASGALLLLLAVGFGLITVVELFARYGARRPLVGPELADRIASYFGIGFAGIALLALPAALAAPFAHGGDPPLRSHSALALVPGCLIAVAACVIAIAATAWIRENLELGLTLAYRQIVSAFGSYVFLSLPALVAVSAALGGARTPEATAAVAGPAILAGYYGNAVEASISNLLVATLAPALIAAAATAVAYAVAPARAVTPWLAGWALAIGLALVIASGLFTPTETAGLIAIFGIVIAIPVRVLALGQPIAPILRQAGMETAAVVCCLAALLLVSTPLVFAGIPRALVDASGAGVASVAAAAAISLVLAYFLTPLLAMALMLPLVFPVVQHAAFDTTFAGAVLILLGLAAAMARAARRQPEAPGLSLRPAVAWILAALLLALAAAVAIVPKIALVPVEAILR
ncbi:MAG TPA: hypothetical protein VIF14_00515 [Alphaproteobacteria bacterium]|jgi:TRAP-type C4-dicarboxylate transport system permease large subunit